MTLFKSFPFTAKPVGAASFNLGHDSGIFRIFFIFFRHDFLYDILYLYI